METRPSNFYSLFCFVEKNAVKHSISVRLSICLSLIPLILFICVSLCHHANAITYGTSMRISLPPAPSACSFGWSVQNLRFLMRTTVCRVMWITLETPYIKNQALSTFSCSLHFKQMFSANFTSLRNYASQVYLVSLLCFSVSVNAFFLLLNGTQYEVYRRSNRTSTSSFQTITDNTFQGAWDFEAEEILTPLNVRL